MAADHDALRQWSQQHDGYDVARSRMVRGWLRGMHAIATPIANVGIPPTAITIAGVAVAAGAVKAARPDRPARLAAGLVMATALCDGLDGAVALRRLSSGRRVSGHGAAIDHTADRMTDVLFAAALARAGASLRVAVAAGSSTLCYEGIRSLHRRRHGVEGLVTVGERPIRIACVCTGLMAAPDAGAAIVALLAAAAVVQVLRR